MVDKLSSGKTNIAAGIDHVANNVVNNELSSASATENVVKNVLSPVNAVDKTTVGTESLVLASSNAGKDSTGKGLSAINTLEKMGATENGVKMSEFVNLSPGTIVEKKPIVTGNHVSAANIVKSKDSAGNGLSSANAMKQTNSVGNVKAAEKAAVGTGNEVKMSEFIIRDPHLMARISQFNNMGNKEVDTKGIHDVKPIERTEIKEKEPEHSLQNGEGFASFLDSNSRFQDALGFLENNFESALLEPEKNKKEKKEIEPNNENFNFMDFMNLEQMLLGPDSQSPPRNEEKSHFAFDTNRFEPFGAENNAHNIPANNNIQSMNTANKVHNVETHPKIDLIPVFNDGNTLQNNGNNVPQNNDMFHNVHINMFDNTHSNTQPGPESVDQQQIPSNVGEPTPPPSSKTGIHPVIDSTSVSQQQSDMTNTFEQNMQPQNSVGTQAEENNHHGYAISHPELAGTNSPSAQSVEPVVPSTSIQHQVPEAVSNSIGMDASQAFVHQGIERNAENVHNFGSEFQGNHNAVGYIEQRVFQNIEHAANLDSTKNVMNVPLLKQETQNNDMNFANVDNTVMGFSDNVINDNSVLSTQSGHGNGQTRQFDNGVIVENVGREILHPQQEVKQEVYNAPVHAPQKQIVDSAPETTYMGPNAATFSLKPKSASNVFHMPDYTKPVDIAFESTSAPVPETPVMNELPMNEQPAMPKVIDSEVPMAVLPNMPKVIESQLPMVELPNMPKVIDSEVPMAVLPNLPKVIESQLPMVEQPNMPKVIDSEVPMAVLPNMQKVTESQLPMVEIPNMPKITESELPAFELPHLQNNIGSEFRMPSTATIKENDPQTQQTVKPVVNEFKMPLSIKASESAARILSAKQHSTNIFKMPSSVRVESVSPIPDTSQSLDTTNLNLENSVTAMGVQKPSSIIEMVPESHTDISSEGNKRSLQNGHIPILPFADQGGHTNGERLSLTPAILQSFDARIGKHHGSVAAGTTQEQEATFEKSSEPNKDIIIKKSLILQQGHNDMPFVDQVKSDGSGSNTQTQASATISISSGNASNSATIMGIQKSSATSNSATSDVQNIKVSPVVHDTIVLNTVTNNSPIGQSSVSNVQDNTESSKISEKIHQTSFSYKEKVKSHLKRAPSKAAHFSSKVVKNTMNTHNAPEVTPGVHNPHSLQWNQEEDEETVAVQPNAHDPYAAIENNQNNAAAIENLEAGIYMGSPLETKTKQTTNTKSTIPPEVEVSNPSNQETSLTGSVSGHMGKVEVNPLDTGFPTEIGMVQNTPIETTLNVSQQSAINNSTAVHEQNIASETNALIQPQVTFTKAVDAGQTSQAVNVEQSSTGERTAAIEEKLIASQTQTNIKQNTHLGDASNSVSTNGGKTNDIVSHETIKNLSSQATKTSQNTNIAASNSQDPLGQNLKSTNKSTTESKLSVKTGVKAKSNLSKLISLPKSKLGKDLLLGVLKSMKKKGFKLRGLAAFQKIVNVIKAKVAKLHKPTPAPPKRFVPSIPARNVYVQRYAYDEDDLYDDDARFYDYLPQRTWMF